MGERINIEGEEKIGVDTEREKCPSCGSNLVFDPESQSLYCEHCGTKIKIERGETAKELNLIDGFDKDGKDNAWDQGEATVFSCDNCGAKVVLKKGQTAESCPFCGTAHVVKTEELPGLKPNGLLPFAFGLEKAVEYAKNWAKKRFFAPRKFKKSIKTDNVNGVYMPCFTFDSSTYTTYTARLGKNKTRTVGSGKNRRTETYTEWRTVSGKWSARFDDVLVTAGSKFGQNQLDKVSPYETNGGVTYDEKYMLGYMAYHYDRDLEDCWGSAKSVMDAEIKRQALSQYSYDVVGSYTASTTHSGVTYKYVMLPVYLGNYKYAKKFYNFFVNGRTGKVAGKTPVSFWKVLLVVLGGIALAALIGYIIYLTSLE